MIGFVLCFLALGSSFIAGRRSRAAGLIVVMFWGYLYGILRANFLSAASQFIFDSSIIAFYATQTKVLFGSSKRTRTVQQWLLALVLWPCIVCFFPFQPFLISLVGLRGNVFFLPMLLIGAELTVDAWATLAKGYAALNVMALAFAIAEYQVGVPKFFPVNAVTRIIYGSHDVGGFKYFRIPSTFYTAHAFGGAMVVSLPVLFGLFARQTARPAERMIGAIGMIAALFGVLLSSTRIHFIAAALVCLAVLFSRELNAKARIPLCALLLITGIVASTNSRMGRFKSLNSTDVVTDRVSGSVNATFWDLISQAPMGNGLAGGGTSVPYFLAGEVRHPMVAEDDYARMAMELGVPGLLLWLSFIIWFTTSSQASSRAVLRGGRRVAWVCVMTIWGISFIGLGTLTAIPASATMLLLMGWVATRETNVRFLGGELQRPLVFSDAQESRTVVDPLELSAKGVSGSCTTSDLDRWCER